MDLCYLLIYTSSGSLVSVLFVCVTVLLELAFLDRIDTGPNYELTRFIISLNQLHPFLWFHAFLLLKGIH